MAEHTKSLRWKRLWIVLGVGLTAAMAGVATAFFFPGEHGGRPHDAAGIVTASGALVAVIATLAQRRRHSREKQNG